MQQRKIHRSVGQSNGNTGFMSHTRNYMLFLKKSAKVLPGNRVTSRARVSVKAISPDHGRCMWSMKTVNRWDGIRASKGFSLLLKAQKDVKIPRCPPHRISHSQLSHRDLALSVRP